MFDLIPTMPSTISIILVYIMYFSLIAIFAFLSVLISVKVEEYLEYRYSRMVSIVYRIASTAFTVLLGIFMYPLFSDTVQYLLDLLKVS